MTDQPLHALTFVSAAEIYDTAPLGAIIRYSDLTPEPPQRFKNKHALWRRNNGSGRLITKTAADTSSCRRWPAQITLHTGDYGSNGVVVMTCRCTFFVDNPLRFAIVETPAEGAIAVMDQGLHAPELLHLADSPGDAQSWLANNSHPDAYLEPITSQTASA